MRRTATYRNPNRIVHGYGGFQAVAEALSEEPPGRPVSRQGVYSWYINREKTGFPDMVRVQEPTVRNAGLAFDIQAAKQWYAEWWIARSEGRIKMFRGSPYRNIRI